jgi:hypothetical protein
MLFFKQPKSHPRLGDEERELILDGQRPEMGRRLLRTDQDE